MCSTKRLYLQKRKSVCINYKGFSDLCLGVLSNIEYRCVLSPDPDREPRVTTNREEQDNMCATL